MSFWIIGSPPVTQTVLQDPIRSMISVTVISVPPVNEYLVSHQEQSRLQPTVLTNTVGTPMVRPSPCMDLKISHILIGNLVLVAGLFESGEPQPAGIAVAACLLAAVVA